MTVDLRSDLVSPPSSAMIDAMVSAARSAPGFGLTDDPMVTRLERMAAERLEKESALFCPTCTLCNQIAVHLYCRPGESFLAEASSHIIYAEAGAVAAMSGAMPIPVPGRRGVLDPDRLNRALRKGDAQRSRTALIVMENTHVYEGGAVVPIDAMRATHEFARNAGIPVHLDGARMFNAAVALGVTGAEIARYADSVSFNLNKGLGAPLGAVLTGDASFIAEAVRVRQMFGGGWRPAGIPAAAGIVALETMVDRLADDHRNARQLAEGLVTCPHVTVNPDEVETNIVMVDLDPAVIAAPDLAIALETRGVLAMELPVSGRNAVRLVTHCGIGVEDVHRVLEAFDAVLRGS